MLLKLSRNNCRTPFVFIGSEFRAKLIPVWTFGTVSFLLGERPLGLAIQPLALNRSVVAHACKAAVGPHQILGPDLWHHLARKLLSLRPSGQHHPRTGPHGVHISGAVVERRRRLGYLAG